MSTVTLDVFFNGDSVTLRDVRHLWPNRSDFVRSLVEMCKEAGEVMVTDENEDHVEIEVVLA